MKPCPNPECRSKNVAAMGAICGGYVVKCKNCGLQGPQRGLGRDAVAGWQSLFRDDPSDPLNCLDCGAAGIDGAHQCAGALPLPTVTAERTLGQEIADLRHRSSRASFRLAELRDERSRLRIRKDEVETEICNLEENLRGLTSALEVLHASVERVAS